MSYWPCAGYVGFDTETTGVDTYNDRIVTAAIITRKPTEIATKRRTDPQKDPATTSTLPADFAQTITWLLNPGIEIPSEASAVHGISTEKARECGADPKEALEEIASTLTAHIKAGRAILAYNGRFDMTILRQELLRYNLPTLEQRLGVKPSENGFLLIDPLTIDRALDKYRKGPRKLINLVKFYGAPERDFHQADADVEATLDVWEKMLAKYPQLLELEASDLMDYQKEAYAESARSYARYRERIGSPIELSDSWPYED